MDFTFALLKHELETSGMHIAAVPKKLDRTFKIASAPEGLPQSSDTLAIYTRATLPMGLDSSLCVLVICPSEDGATGVQEEAPAALVVVSDRAPFWFAERINLYIASVMSWLEQMDDIIESGGNAEQLLESSEPILGHYAALSDALYRKVAITPGIQPIDPFSKTLVETGQYPSGGIHDIEKLASQEKWSESFRTIVSQEGNLINPMPNASRIFRLNGHYAAQLVMVCEEDIDAGELFLFDLLADKVGALLDKEWKERDPYAQPYTAFLERAFSSPAHDRGYFLAQATRLGIPTEGVYEVCVIAGAQNHGGLNHLTRQIHLALSNSWALIMDDKIYVLLYAPAQKTGQIASTEQQLFEFASRLDSEVGVSDRSDDLEFLYLGRLEADIALKYGHRHVSKYDAFETLDPNLYSMFRFKRYLPYYLVDPEANTASFITIFENSPHPLNRIRWADRENGTHDMSLLRIYLYCDSNARRTADIMHMHRNTVDYRLKRIRELYHLDLSDSDTRLCLHYLFGVLD